MAESNVIQVRIDPQWKKRGNAALAKHGERWQRLLEPLIKNLIVKLEKTEPKKIVETVEDVG